MEVDETLSHLVKVRLGTLFSCSFVLGADESSSTSREHNSSMP
jgi:hypothetical protein